MNFSPVSLEIITSQVYILVEPNLFIYRERLTLLIYILEHTSLLHESILAKYITGHIQAGRKASRHAGRHADIQIGRKEGMKTVRQDGRQAGR